MQNKIKELLLHKRNISECTQTKQILESKEKNNQLVENQFFSQIENDCINKLLIDETILKTKIQWLKSYVMQYFPKARPQNKKRQALEKYFTNHLPDLPFYPKKQSYFTFRSQLYRQKNKKINNFVFLETQGSDTQAQISKFHYLGQTKAVELLNSANEEKDRKVMSGFGIIIKVVYVKRQNITQPSSIQLYQGDFVNNLKYGSGISLKINYPRKIEIYIGKYLNDKQYDQNAVYMKCLDDFSEQQRYYGGFLNGQRHGKGCFQVQNQCYNGQWRFDKPEGIGNLETKISNYQGFLKCGQKWGAGRETFFNGDQYTGQYKNDLPNGFGKYVWINGSFYVGNFVEGLRQGKGSWKYGNQSFEGTFLKDKKAGYGIQSWKDGQTYYRGSFEDDMRQGYGQMSWNNGVTIYKGYWKQNQQQGFGELHHFDKEEKHLIKIERGHFQKGKLIVLTQKIQLNQKFENQVSLNQNQQHIAKKQKISSQERLKNSKPNNSEESLEHRNQEKKVCVNLATSKPQIKNQENKHTRTKNQVRYKKTNILTPRQKFVSRQKVSESHDHLYLRKHKVVCQNNIKSSLNSFRKTSNRNSVHKSKCSIDKKNRVCLTSQDGSLDMHKSKALLMKQKRIPSKVSQENQLIIWNNFRRRKVYNVLNQNLCLNK